MTASRGVRYTVPATVHPARLDGSLTLRLRVDNVYRNKTLAVYAGQDCLWRRKRPVLAPGEMETIVIKGAALDKLPGCGGLTVTLEEV